MNMKNQAPVLAVGDVKPVKPVNPKGGDLALHLLSFLDRFSIGFTEPKICRLQK